MIEFHWIALGSLLALLTALLLWGMRQDPRVRRAAMAREIAADDPVVDPPSSPGRLPAVIDRLLSDRRMLASAWGDDVPDLLVSYWTIGEEASRGIPSHHQTFLPFQFGPEDALAQLESLIFEAAQEQGIAERAHFVRCFAFIRLPDRPEDLLLESRFVDGRFRHEGCMVDADGRIMPLPVEGMRLGELLGPSGWLAWRQGIAEIGEGDESGIAASLLEEARDQGVCRGRAHGWMAAAARAGGANLDEVRRHLALAHEFAPHSALVRLERAQLMGPAALRRHLATLRATSTGQYPHDPHAGFLLAQSLLALHQPAAARALCDQLLTDFPRHPGVLRLLLLIDRKERGAQT